jgi:hypothetical protein
MGKNHSPDNAGEDIARSSNFKPPCLAEMPGTYLLGPVFGLNHCFGRPSGLLPATPLVAALSPHLTSARFIRTELPW